MEDKKGNVILGIILAVLMIIAIVIVIKNPNKTETLIETNPASAQEEKNNGNPVSNTYAVNTDAANKKEEKEESMQVGGTLCKIENKVVFYQDINKSIYLYNLDENETSKLATLENGANKIYFDGENIYCIPSYYSGKGIYKVDLQGNVQKIYKNASLQLWITEDKIYFVKQIGYDEINGNPQGTLCVMDKDGNNIVELAQNIKNYFFIQDEKIYYTTQDRKMYVINKDGTNQEEINQGRRFVIATSEKYLLYIDYANQEAEHIVNLETKEDKIIGHFGLLKKCQGKTYLNARKRLDDGSIEKDYTLFEIQEDGTVKEHGKYADFATDLKYIVKGKAYLSNDKEGTYTINLDDNKKESADNYKECKYFLGGYGYKIDDTNAQEIKVERIEL